MKLLLTLAVLATTGLAAPVIQTIQASTTALAPLSPDAAEASLAGLTIDSSLSAQQISAIDSSMNDLGTLTTTLQNNPSALNAVSCKPIIVIFARGTWEPGPAPGMLVGYWFGQDVEKKYPGKVAVQSVKYDASNGGYLSGGSASGGKTMAKMVENTASSCPNSKIIMGGYR